MEPVRFSPFLPQSGEPELSDAPAETKPRASVEVPASSTTASGNEGKVLQPGSGDEVLIAFERGDERMPFLTGSLWNAGTPPTSAPPPAEGPGGTQAAATTGPQGVTLTDEQLKLINHHLRNLK